MVELHGNTTYATCLACGLRHELEPILESFAVDEIPPVCRDCGGMVKTATVSFGQTLPPAAVERAEVESLECDLFIAVGSSLVVYPAAGFPVLAKRNGARLVILNRESTDLDGIADVVINGEIGATLGDAVGVT